MQDLEDEAKRVTEHLGGKRVRTIWRHRAGELAVEFSDGTRLFVDAKGDVLELSITGGSP